MSTAMVPIQKRVDEFRAAFVEGINGIVKAAEIYVAAIDENPKAADIFRKKCADWIPAGAWAQFESVGRKWMHPRLIMGGIADRKKHAKIKQLPYSMQERVFNNERFPLLTHDRDTLQVELLEATDDQVEQLCNGSAIRNESEQRAWMEARQKETVEEVGEPMPYVVRDGKVTFRRNTTLTRTEVKRLLQEM